MAPAEPRVPLTLDELLAHLIQSRALHPAQGQRLVHLLDMAGDDGDGLITAVDLDCFDERRGPVISLLSGPMPDTGTDPGLAVTFTASLACPASGSWRPAGSSSPGAVTDLRYPDRYASHGKAYH